LGYNIKYTVYCYRIVLNRNCTFALELLDQWEIEGHFDKEIIDFARNFVVNVTPQNFVGIG